MSKIVLWVSSIQRQGEFYQDLLGLSRTAHTGEFSEVSDGTNSVLLHLLPAEFRSSASEAREDQPIKPVFTIDDLQQAVDQISQYGVAIKSAAKHGKYLYQDLVDLEGNVIQLQQLASE
jgi:catechol-2,3-dioxygenase